MEFTHVIIRLCYVHAFSRSKKIYDPPFGITGFQMTMYNEGSSRRTVPSYPDQTALANVFFATNYESPCIVMAHTEKTTF